MKNVLVASDLMPRSDVAFRRAAILAGQVDATLHVVHVLEEHDANQENAAGERLDREIAALPQAVSGRAIIRIGPPDVAIMAAAEEVAADLIVLGAHAKRLARIFIGTTVERVMRGSGRPVLMVNLPPAGAYQRVMLPVDLSQASAEAIRAANVLGLFAVGEVHVVHAFEALAKTTMIYAGAQPTAIRSHVHASLQKAAAELGTFLLESDIATLGYEVILEEGPPFLGIKKAAERIDPDLIVIATRNPGGLKRVLLGGVADEVLRRMSCDILAVRPTDHP